MKKAGKQPKNTVSPQDLERIKSLSLAASQAQDAFTLASAAVMEAQQKQRQAYQAALDTETLFKKEVDTQATLLGLNTGKPLFFDLTTGTFTERQQ